MSRWPATRPTRTLRPDGYLLVLPPALVTVVVPAVGTPCSGSFQRIRRAMASRAALLCGTEVWVPMLEMPVVWAL